MLKRPAKKARIAESTPNAGSKPAPTKEPKRSKTKTKTKGKSPVTLTPLPTSFKIIAGSYEKLLYGLSCSISTSTTNQGDLEYTLKPLFIFPAHVSCIKAVAASPQGGKWLATGSTDEIIKVWDLKKKKEVGGLMHHQGSITHLLFPTRSHLLSASEDGSLCLFRARDWVVLRAMKGHKGRVNSVSIHPSGKVALSVGKDRALRMWDLMRGKGVASTKIFKEGELVRWSIDGTKFIVQSGSTIDVYSTNMDLLVTIKHPSRLHDVQFAKHIDNDAEEFLLVGGEDRKVSVYAFSPTEESQEDKEEEEETTPKPKTAPRIIAEFVGHTNRIKGFQTINVALPTPNSSGRSSTTILATVSSDGFMKVYDMAEIPSPSPPGSESSPESTKKIEALTSYDSKDTRFTCIALADGDLPNPPSSANGKRKREEEEGSHALDEIEPESDDEDDQGSGSEQEDEEEEEGEGDYEDEEEDDE